MKSETLHLFAIGLPGQPIPREPLPDDLTNRNIEPGRILQRLPVVVLAVVVAVGLLVQVPKQVKRLKRSRTYRKFSSLHSAWT
jgi:hypothetical protein